jgi:hypothetical protein
VQQETPKPVPASPAKQPPPKPSAAAKRPSGVDHPLMKRNSLEGVIWYLTKKHGGNVCEKGIVAITSKSVYSGRDCYAVKNLAHFADLSTKSVFYSADAPGQWVCWDFGGMIVRPTHYTIRGECLRSWVVEGSQDGGTWTELDGQTGKADFDRKYDGEASPADPDWNTASFAVVNLAEFRFIRLMQTDKGSDGLHSLTLYAVEFFGTLSE